MYFAFIKFSFIDEEFQNSIIGIFKFNICLFVYLFIDLDIY